MISLNAADEKWVDGIWEKLDRKLSKTAVDVFDFFPYTTKEGIYVEPPKEGPVWWTNGFYGGMMWLMYHMTGKAVYKACAEHQELMMDEAFHVYDGLHHDVGFQWNLLSKAHYALDGNPKSRVRALHAANILAGRVNIRGKYLRAWDKLNLSIIDTMMNLPLLYWASREVEDDRFRFIAEMQADMTMREHVRPDGSVAHVAVHDDLNDRVLETLAGQGYAVGTAWSRGQAWALYGFILSYIHTGKKAYLDTCKKVADYFLEYAEKTNYKTPTDFNQPPEPFYIDNSAGACAACGLIELYKQTGEEKYLTGAIRILRALEEDCIFDDTCQSILQKGMESYGRGKQLHLIYADFFLVEAIAKLKNSDFLIW